MRILYLSPWFPFPPDNGSKIRIYYLLRALAEHHDVSLLSFAFDSAKPEDSRELDQFCHQVFSVSGNPFVKNEISPFRRFLSLRPVVTKPIPEMAIMTKNALSKDNYDVLIASSEVMAMYVLHAPSKYTKVLEEHNSYLRWMWDRYLGQKDLIQKVRCRLTVAKRRRFDKWLFPHFDLVTVVSQQDRDAILSVLGNGENRVSIVPNGVDCNKLQPNPDVQGPKKLVYNGALTYRANFDAMRYFLREIYPLIKEAIPAITLDITGSTKDIDVKELKLDNSVKLTGYLKNVYPTVANASVCVVPLREGGGTRLKILEAMALGTAVVSTSKGAEGLNLIDGEHLLIADDPESFAMSTIRLIQDNRLRLKLSGNARKLVESEYDWLKIGQNFVSLVENTCHSNRSI